MNPTLPILITIFCLIYFIQIVINILDLGIQPEEIKSRARFFKRLIPFVFILWGIKHIYKVWRELPAREPIEVRFTDKTH